ncbi:hypothetical protein SAMN05421759_11099 [Roseivivax lentus]|uniref:Permease n=1 Tax=Roseivivax lentus TaxID=633194 RepID=A0A1N7NVK7_9RHOB|nr:permease [Roseivivax lentus]SIT02328.1 hypothetical protein SAMN05421759_11099 [Roseivivax lentus]
MELVETFGQAAKTAIGFFWKSGWAFVLGYTISAMIQAFMPKAQLTRQIGTPGLRSVGIASLFGAISSSCSFAALAAARSLLAKGAHFVATVAFMFASTNLVIELGILIFIFLGWQFLVAEVIGGVILIAVSSVLIRLSYPRSWIEAARESAEQEAPDEAESFDWRQRITSLDGWTRVGRGFVMEWQMVWQEILIGFTLAGFIAVFVPDSVWKAIFLAEQAQGGEAGFLLVLQNAMVAPFVAAATFIGSMGNIPLATILASSGVLFAGIMGFIYSDLMVPPLVKVNAKYYGWRVALYIAAVMYVSIVATAIILHYGFDFAGMLPESTRRAGDVATFAIDYTFWLNIVALMAVAGLTWLSRRRAAFEEGDDGHDHDHDHGNGSGLSLQDGVAALAVLALIVGMGIWLLG